MSLSKKVCRPLCRPGRRPTKLVARLRITQPRRASAWASFILGCAVQSGGDGTGSESSTEETESASVPREGVAPGPAPDDGEEIPFYNPWMELANVPGETPFVERLDDENGNRFVVGQEQYAFEDGTILIGPAVRTMTPSVPDPEELVGLEEVDAVAPDPKVTDDLLDAMAGLGDDDNLTVILWIRHDDPGRQAQLDLAMATGAILTREDYDEHWDLFAEQRRERILSATTPVVEAIEAVGGVVLARRKALASITASLTVSAVSMLADRDDVTFIDVPNHIGVPIANNDGLVHQDGAQIRQFVLNGFTGNGATGGSADDLTVAIIEVNDEGGGVLRSFHTTHNGYRDSGAGSAFRFADGAPTGLWECDDNACDDVPDFSDPPGDHSTQIAGIIMGDFTYPQIPSMPVADRERASGFAPEVRAHFYSVLNHEDAVVAAFDHIIDMPAAQHPPHVINNSYRFPGSPICRGNSSIAQSANEAYMAGFAVIAGAGNEGGSAVSCTIGAPGDAIGSFTVGAHMDDDFAGTVLHVRTASIFDEPGDVPPSVSGWGGNANQGGNRSIISITAAARRSYVLDDQVGPPPDFVDGWFQASPSNGATSYATAVVSAVGIDIMDFKFKAGNSYIDAPGALYAELLLMGDRQATGGYGTKTPDHRWGVGRLRARIPQTSGLDLPSFWGENLACMGANESFDFSSIASMEASVDAVKASAFWIKRDHHVVASVPQINLTLHDAANNKALVADPDADDNKAYVYYANWPAAPVILRLITGSGGFAGHHEPVCGGVPPNNKVLVYFAVFAEDNARDGAITCSTASANGVYPENGVCPHP